MESARAIDELQVNGDGLRAEAGWCASLAGRLAGSSAPAGAGSSPLASSAVVSAAHAGIAAAGTRCSFRIQATAARLALASVGYFENEASSAAQMRALGRVTVF
jgi:hypothetical protein